MDGSVITLADVKNYLGITTADKDTALSAVLLGAEARIRKYIGRNLLLSDYIEKHNSGGQGKLILKNYPVTELTSFQYNTGTLGTPVWTDFDADSYVLDQNTGIIHLEGCKIPKGVQNIKVVYSAGYDSDDIPEDIRFALYKLVDILWQEKGVEGIVSEKADDVSVQYANRGEMSQTVKVVLDKYKKYV